MRAVYVSVIAIATIIALVVLAASAGPSARAQSTTTVRIGDIWFCDPSYQNGVCETTVTAGDTVVWDWGVSGSGTTFSHTTTNCADNYTSCSGPREWDSGVQTSGTFSHAFGPEDAGKTFLYLCQIHPLQMRGSITVVAAPTPTPQPTPTPTPQPSPVPGSSPTPAAATATPAGPTPAAVPNGGGAPPAAGQELSWLAGLGLGGLALAVAAGAAVRAARR